MATAKIWKGVAVAMQSAIGTAQVITSITKASPAVLASSGTLPTAGQYVLVSAQGMSQVDARVFRVIAPGAGVFTLEGEDSTLYDTFTSGTFQILTFGTSITTATTIQSAGGTFPFIDTTTIHASAKTQIPGLSDAASFTMENIWDVSDAGLLAMKAAGDSQGQRAFKFTFGLLGNIMVFTGYVGATLLPGGQAQGLVTTPSVITLFGRATYYAI